MPRNQTSEPTDDQGLEFLPDAASYVVTEAKRYAIRNSRTGSVERTGPDAKSMGSNVHVDGDGHGMLDAPHAERAGVLREWNLETDTVVWEKPFKGKVLGLQPDGRHVLISGSIDKGKPLPLFVLDRETRKIVLQPDGFHRDACMGWSADGKFIRVLGDSLYEMRFVPPTTP